MRYKKSLLLAIIGLALVAGCVVVFKKSATKNADMRPQSKLLITTSFYPLAFLAQEIGGPYINVTNITPAGVEPHDFEPSPRDINTIYKSKLFIFNGGSIDSWAEKIKPHLERQGVATSDMLSETPDVPLDLGKADPHVWLDPVLMSKEADIVASALIKIDSTHVQEYNSNKEALKHALASLDTQYQTGLASCQLREIVTSHNAFNYLARRYNFQVLHILGLSPEEEPSAKKIAEISTLAKSKGIKYIFFETMVNPKLSETIANEVGAQTLVLDPIEGLAEQDSKNNQNYLTLMQRNLTNLETAMLCQSNQSLK